MSFFILFLPDNIRIFLSYARPDASTLASNVNDYYSNRLQGYEVFIDTLKIEGGIDWSDKIKEEINNSEIVIALITEAVFKSKYIPGEIKEAIDRQKFVIPCVRSNVDLTKLSTLGLTKEQVIVFNDSELDKLYGKINDSIASYKKNPQKIKEYYEKRKKQKKDKIGISASVGSIVVLVLVAFVLQPQFYIEDKYVFEKSWGILGTSNVAFDNPHGVALDSKDNLHVADSGNNRIQKITPDGNITSIGTQGSGIGEFIYPSGVAIDSKDNLYIGDSYNHRIQKFALAHIWKFEFNHWNK